MKSNYAALIQTTLKPSCFCLGLRLIQLLRMSIGSGGKAQDRTSAPAACAALWQVRRHARSQSDRQPLRSQAPLTAIRGSIASKNGNHLLASISILFAYCWAINGVLCRVMWLLNRVCFPHWAKCTVWLSSNCCWLTLPTVNMCVYVSV